MEKRVVALLTILIRFSGGSSADTFQRRRVVLSRAIDSALGPIWHFLLQLRRAYRRYRVRPGPTRAWWDNFLSGAVLKNNRKRIFGCAKQIFTSGMENCVFLLKKKQAPVIRSS